MWTQKKTIIIIWHAHTQRQISHTHIFFNNNDINLENEKCYGENVTMQGTQNVCAFAYRFYYIIVVAISTTEKTERKNKWNFSIDKMSKKLNDIFYYIPHTTCGQRKGWHHASI